MRIAEGFETACAYAQLTAREAGTCFGLRNFAGFAVGSGIRQVILLPDNDQRECRRQELPWLRGNRPLSSSGLSAAPAGFNDWADMLRLGG
jgi:hypothetical protein